MDYFWNAPEGNSHELVFSHAQHLSNLYCDRVDQHKMNLVAYSRHDYDNIFSSGGDFINQNRRLRLNVVKSVVDTVVARYGTMKVKPMFKTTGGDWETYKKGLKLNKFINAVFLHHNVYRKGKNSVKGGAIYGKSGLYVYHADGKIEVENVPAYEMLFDERESLSGNPSFMFRIKEVGREELKNMTNIPEEKIDAAGILPLGWSDYTDERAAHRINIIQAWKLPTAHSKGRYIACLNNYTITDEEWKEDDFPIVTYGWHSSDSGGVWPESLSHELSSIQLEINELLKKAQRQMKLAGFMVFVEKGSKINKGALTNMDGSVIEFNNQPPVFHTVQAVAPETWRQIESLIDKAYEITGVNRLSSQGQKPSGLNSGVALREYNDLGSERMKDIAQDIEDFYCSVAKATVAVARSLAEEGATTEVMAESKNMLEKISWDEVDLDEDKYRIGVYPTNFFATSPSAKYQQASEMHEKGQINDAEFAQLMDMPDLDMVMQQKNAPYQLIMDDIERINDGERYQSLDAFTDFALAGPMVQASFVQSRNRGAPEEIQDMYRDYLLRLESIIKEVEEQQAPPPPPPMEGPPMGPPPEGMAPPGMPMPPMPPV